MAAPILTGVRRVRQAGRGTAATAMMLLSCACSTVAPPRPGDDPMFAATPPIMAAGTAAAPALQSLPAVSDGAIYHAGTAVRLFEDYKARRVGDVLSVLLAERTDARKSAQSSSSKDFGVSVSDPVLFGRPVTRNGIPIFNADVNASREFDGGGDAAQSNELDGTITVTVAEVLPNGNLVVQGEKWLQLNHGEEYLRLRGIVRPVDIGPDNTVLSTQVADARIAYSGTGVLADSSVPGWLNRFFSSPLWPF